MSNILMFKVQPRKSRRRADIYSRINRLQKSEETIKRRIHILVERAVKLKKEREEIEQYIGEHG